MIGSFWNLCRACPSMPVDKLHSEYRSTYRWHEYTGGSRPEVIRRPPAANQFASSADNFFSKSTEADERHVEGTCNEPPLPRRKKCPELAYKTHEFINCDQSASTNYRNDNNSINRARTENRGNRGNRRSKSEGPHRHVDAAVDEKGSNGQAGESSGIFRKTFSKLSTEYRLQFIWPHTRNGTHNSEDGVDLPRKSLSMGVIKSARSNAIPIVHKKRTTHEKEATVQELEPLFDVDGKSNKKVSNRKTIRPFSQYSMNEIRQKQGMTDKENFGFVVDSETTNKVDEKTVMNGHDPNAAAWYKDVIELRKKAGEYKHRGWGVEIQPDMYNKQKELWDQVSRRSSLSALSLASSIHNRPISKEEKEKENKNKSSPIKPNGRAVPGQVHFVDNRLCDGVTNRLYNVRHHLERTTGPDVEEGALLPSPTREKLIPTIPKSKDDESYNSQRGSPKKSATSRHGSPQKGSPQKSSSSPKKVLKQSKGRSQSVGPVTTNADGSPKRQIRSGSAVPNATSTSSSKPYKKTPVSTPTIVERRPRPTTLPTSNSRSKSSSLPPNGRSYSNHQNQNLPNDTHKLSPLTLTIPNLKKSYKSNKHQRPKSTIINGYNDPMTESTIKFDQPEKIKGQDNKTGENDDDDTDKDGGSISSASPLPAHEIIEHIVKSPPEPTRVKSPEQILMRSPDPVNWTVPLDTGKTFTVTQNVRDGDPILRPQSELKASTPVDKPPAAPMSAPPELAEPLKNDSYNDKLSTVTAINKPDVRFDKPVPGSTLRCIDDPTFDPAINSPSALGISKD
ncbi:uncharacterized protein LOC119068092 isoform X1 [Bradysia coprophila]|uniref:uncharacterized protein LOC119068092 isoform X1 n=1 Tax=Bradysia coprophila TaxID=38358 RepID=UPI00187D889E|nr:uncharacterized protein LOC119068092 isoform X1 [Bradysia coprophila]